MNTQSEQERDWSLLEATQESLREHMAEVKRLQAIVDKYENGILNHFAEQPAQQQEAVAWADLNARTEQFNSVNCGTAYRLPGENRQPLYTSPQPSKPLTDEQIMEMYNEPRSDAEMLEFARAIEAAHGIKGDA